MDEASKLPPVEVLLTREESIAAKIDRLIGGSRSSIVAALYRLNSKRLGRALQEAAERGVSIRVVLDWTKYEESEVTREIVANGRFAFRLAPGRKGRGSKMHHKFALIDETIVLTGSYNWTDESEEDNYENLLILREPAVIAIYRLEFEKLWAEAK
ncbi:MAG: phospholipase D-like domain-containing protein [Terriglobia bacterium]